MRFPWQQKRVNLAAIGMYTSGVALSPPRNLRTFALDAFSRNPLVFACIAFKAQSASDIRLVAEQQVAGQWVAAADATTPTPEADALQALLDNPNPYQDQTEWLADTITCQQTTGNAYTQIELSGAGRPVALWHLPQPERMQVIPDAMKYIAGYRYATNAGLVDLEPEQVIHFRELPDPLNPLLGLAPAVPVAGEIDADNSATDFLKQFFDKGGVPALALITKMQLPEAEAKKLKARWQSEFSLNQGGNAAGGLAVLNGAEMELQKIGSTTGSREMGLTEIRQVIEARICGAWRVHPQVAYTLLGFLHPTYAQARVAQESSWTEGLKPMYARYAGKLSVKFRAFFPHCRVTCDYSQVAALAEDQDALWERHQKAFDSGAEAFEEFRDAVHLPSDAKGVHFVPFNRLEWHPGEPLAPRVAVTETATVTPEQVREEQEGEPPTGPAASAAPTASDRRNGARPAPPAKSAGGTHSGGTATLTRTAMPLRLKTDSGRDDAAVHKLIATGGAAVAALAAQLAAGAITRDDFLTRATTALRAGMYAAAGLAAGEALDADAIDGLLDDGLDAFTGYAADVADGSLSAAQMASRAAQWAGLAWTAYQAGRVQAAAPEAAITWVCKDDKSSCDDCVALAEGSPYTAETLPTFPGQAVACNGNCRCALDTADATDEGDA